MVGFGIVATALLEVFNLEDIYKDVDFLVIEPEPIKYDLFDGRRYKHIREYLTQDNINKLLKDADKNTLIIDLTVDMDSIMIIKYAKKCGSMYINTSVENWEDFNTTNKKMDTYDDIKNNTLYHRQLLIDKLLDKSKITRVVNFGMNPGGVSEIAKYTIREYAKLKNKKLVNGDYAKLCSELGVLKLLIVEYDNTKTNLDIKKNIFYNDWSPLGLQAEGIDAVMISVSIDDEKRMEEDGIKLIKPNEGRKDTRIRFIPSMAVDMFDESITYDPNGNIIEYKGYLIPHAEIVSLSNFLNYKGNSPTIYYCYRPCDDALESIENLRKNNYKPLEHFYCIEKKDIINECFDSIGVLLVCENGDHFWGGTVLTLDDVNKLGFIYSSPTAVQVAGWIFASIKYMIKYPNIGLNEAETMKSRELMKNAEKYMGRIFYKLYKV
jgi:homospermidine synthase